MSSGGWLVVSPDVNEMLTDAFRAQFSRITIYPQARPGYAYIIDPDTLSVTNIVTGKSS